MSNLYDITAYGAVPGTDCTVALVEAANDADATGGTLYIPPGVWGWRDLVCLPSCTVGAGRRWSILKAASPTARLTFYPASNEAQGQEVHSVCISGGGSGGAPYGFVISEPSASTGGQSVFRDCEFRDYRAATGALVMGPPGNVTILPTAAVYLKGQRTFGVLFDNCWWRNNDTPIYIGDRAGNIVFHRCRIAPSPASTRLVILDGSMGAVDSIAFYGFAISTDASAKQPCDVFWIDSATNVLLSGGETETDLPGDVAIRVAAATSAMSDLAIQGCKMMGNGTATNGIRLEAAGYAYPGSPQGLAHLTVVGSTLNSYAGDPIVDLTSVVDAAYRSTKTILGTRLNRGFCAFQQS